jgi:hypothetical protein
MQRQYAAPPLPGKMARRDHARPQRRGSAAAAARIRAEQGRIADLYGKAVEQLGADTLDVRIGGVYALERVARYSARDDPTVIEVLTAFIRVHSHEQLPAPGGGGTPSAQITRPDVQAAITVIGRRDPDRDIQPCDLTDVNLPGVNLTGARPGASSDRRRPAPGSWRH